MPNLQINKKTIIILTGLICIAAVGFVRVFYVDEQYGTPAATMKTLQSAIQKRRWAIARRCFSSDLQAANLEAFDRQKFLFTDYWSASITSSNFLGPRPILGDDADFTISNTKPDAVTVHVAYRHRLEKDVRPKEFRLRLEADRGWKITAVGSGPNPTNSRR